MERHRAARWAAIFATFTIVAGCAAAPEARVADAFDDELRAAAAARKEPPLVFSVAIAHPIVPGVPSGQEKFVSPRPLDRAAFAGRLVEDFKRLNFFRRIDAVPPHEVSPELDAHRRELAAAARELRSDLVLIPRMKAHEVAYVGASGWWVPSALLCASLWWPTFFLPDEEWSATAAIEAELVSARTGKVIWGPIEFRASRADTFDDFRRGWDLCGPFGIPLFPQSETFGVQEVNCRRVEMELMPEALAEAERALLKSLQGYLAHVKIEIKAVEPQTLALVAGIDAHQDPSIAPLECAESDARAIAKTLRDPAGGGLTDRTLTEAIGSRATRAQILEFFNVTLAKAAPADRAIVYFAGYGAVAPDTSLKSEDPRDPAKGYGYRKYLVAFDTDPKRLDETAIPLDAIAEALERSPAEKIVLIFDTSWGGDIAGRTLAQARPAQGDALDRSFLERLVSRPGRFVVTAADVGGTAQEYPPERHGVFTMILDQALREIGQDRRGRASLADVFEYLRERVPPSSSLVGERQEVQLFGDRAAAETVILVDRARAAPETTTVPLSAPIENDGSPR